MRKKIFVFFLFVTILCAANAQKKELSYEQIFKNAQSDILKPLPQIDSWLDDEHYIETHKGSKDGAKTEYFSVDVKTGNAVPYTKAEEASGISADSKSSNPKEKNLTLSPDKKWAAFTRENNLFARELASGKEIQLSTDGSSTVYNGYAAWVYYEEILGRGSRYRAFWWSPDSRHIAFIHFDEAQVPVFPIYNSEGHHGFTEQQHYPKAGDPNPAVRIGITSVENPKTVWADFDEKTDQYFGMPWWTPDGSSLWVPWMPRKQNNLKLFSVDPSAGSKKEIYDEKQKTWVQLEDNSRIEFISGGKQFILKSDRSGWMHLYLYAADGRLINPITEGDYTVTELVRVDEKEKAVYFKARKENSARVDFYKTGLNGKGLTRLSFGEYTHDNISLSPDGKYFITTYSNANIPTKMALVDGKGKIIRQLADSKGDSFDAYALSNTSIIRVKSSDGLFDLPMSITWPVHFDSTKKYPVLISIYGGPNAGTVYDRFNRAFLTAQWWAKEGVIQVAMDNRSSGHFGKKGMEYIYRKMGIYETEDYMSCGRWLRAQKWVDSSKICITGGSFGGYMTCMALTYGAEVFTHGMANSSVTDWSLYDTHYTERFMDTPADNPEGYKITSPQNYVKQYRGLIRIIHGNMDDNVHMQGSIQLINKLEDLDKHFEFMIYPQERHGWGGLKAVHSRNESFRFIYENLLNRPMPAVFWN